MDIHYKPGNSIHRIERVWAQYSSGSALFEWMKDWDLLYTTTTTDVKMFTCAF